MLVMSKWFPRWTTFQNVSCIFQQVPYHHWPFTPVSLDFHEMTNSNTLHNGEREGAHLSSCFIRNKVSQLSGNPNLSLVQNIIHLSFSSPGYSIEEPLSTPINTIPTASSKTDKSSKRSKNKKKK